VGEGECNVTPVAVVVSAFEIKNHVALSAGTELYSGAQVEKLQRELNQERRRAKRARAERDEARRAERAACAKVCRDIGERRPFVANAAEFFAKAIMENGA
jgi:hypothetical protein